MGVPVGLLPGLAHRCWRISPVAWLQGQARAACFLVAQTCPLNRNSLGGARQGRLPLRPTVAPSHRRQVCHLHAAALTEASAAPDACDEHFMAIALEEARQAAAEGEVPVGTVLVSDGKVVARARNCVELSGDPTAHAELLVIQQAARLLGGWRLSDATLYVTLEPCAMCAGAMLLARLGRLVWGAPNNRVGADGSWVALLPPEGSSAEPEPSRSGERGRQDASACGACCDAAHKPCQGVMAQPEAVVDRSSPAGPSGGQMAGTVQGVGLQGRAARSAGGAELDSRRGGWPYALAGMLRAALHLREWLAGAPAHDSRAGEARGPSSGAALAVGPHEQMPPAHEAQGMRGDAAAGPDLRRADGTEAQLDMAEPLGSAEARQSGQAAGSESQRRAAEQGESGGAEQRPWRPHPTHPTLQVRRRVLEAECGAVLRAFFRRRRAQADAVRAAARAAAADPVAAEAQQ